MDTSIDYVPADGDRGLYRKYEVYRLRYGKPTGGGFLPVVTSRTLVEDDCMVLKLDDPHARHAILAYADSVSMSDHAFATQLREWVASHA